MVFNKYLSFWQSSPSTCCIFMIKKWFFFLCFLLLRKMERIAALRGNTAATFTSTLPLGWRSSYSTAEKHQNFTTTIVDGGSFKGKQKSQEEETQIFIMILFKEIIKKWTTYIKRLIKAFRARIRNKIFEWNNSFLPVFPPRCCFFFLCCMFNVALFHLLLQNKTGGTGRKVKHCEQQSREKRTKKGTTKKDTKKGSKMHSIVVLCGGLDMDGKRKTKLNV